MQPSRNLLWFVIVGLVVVGGLYYFFEGPGKPAPKAPVATETTTPAAEVAPQTTPTAEPASTESSPADATAQDAADSAKRIEENQRKEMMEKPAAPESTGGAAPKE